MLRTNSEIKEITGVGPTRAAQLNKLGIFTVEDLIYNFPRIYEERGNVLPLGVADIGVNQAFLLTVGTAVKTVTLKNKMTISKFKAFDSTGSVEIVFFNAAYVKDIFTVGSEFRFWGKLSFNKSVLQLTSPKYEIYSENEILPDYVPVYSLTQGLGSKFIEKITRTAINAVINLIPDTLPDDIRLKHNLPTLSYAIKNIHFPTDAEALKRSIDRIAFEEMLCFGIGISKIARYKNQGDGVRFSKVNIKDLISKLPYELTNSQKQAINDIYKNTVLGDQNGKISPMARILVGDVGSGKTICAITALYLAAKSGYQSVLMAPTEILAKQHYKDICNLFEDLGITSALLLGSTTQKNKKHIYNAIESGDCDVLIGTHAVLSEKVNFSSLGLVITDEQHRFGVNQRALLKNKSKFAHMLVMSATPIPRTLSLAMYGDLDVSRITDMPIGRQRVDTFLIDESYRERLNEFILKQVQNGGQCYVVCPAIEQNDASSAPIYTEDIIRGNFNKQIIKNATEYADILKQRLPNLNIGLLHGKMKAAEKECVMNAFSSGEIDVLVSTTVIEVGVNVPNASLMVIENAERFGLSQLHQLRGRVGRGNKKSYCILVQGNKSDKAFERLQIMKTTYDGFEIAEKDLIMRGPGDFFATEKSDALRQSGGFSFKTASLCNNTALFDAAFATAKSIIAEDPNLELEKNSLLKEKLFKLISPDNSTIS